MSEIKVFHNEMYVILLSYMVVFRMTKGYLDSVSALLIGTRAKGVTASFIE